ncbi:MAG: cell division protein SepF [Gordonia sp. (in: high G+C Gram-positive bacteria)]|uniref:cell division protein SepF n=1 Tax=Gordonia sp. (in: high G+C Gram-positive bacteria) TaxID=84139 RepID=UPI0039E3F585
MTTMQKFKAYFGMVPPSEYDDDYLADPMTDGLEGHDGMDPRERRYMERYRGGQDEPYYDDYADDGYADGYADDTRFAPDENAGPLRRSPMAEPAPRLAPLSRGAGMPVRGANALAPQSRGDIMAEAAGRITTLRPADYAEARTIGERFRSGDPVIIDLVDMNNDEAKRLVDFAAGLVFALRGSFDKVATKVFLLSPAGVEVTPEDRRRIAESGFSGQH